jgi:uncharacterized protein
MSDFGDDSTIDPQSLVISLFPLPNVVLFPKAVLPLHIFEERYKAMTRDALVGGRTIAMALLRPGWEKSYYSRPAIDPVVCVGRIVSHEELPDGRFNFLLQGMFRAKVVQELPTPAEGGTWDKPYRSALLLPMEQRMSDASVVEAGRDALHTFFTESPHAQTPLGRKFAELTHSALPTPDLADLVAYNFLEDIAMKQQLLSEPDVSRRLPMLLSALGATARPQPSASVRMFKRPGLN